MQRRSATGYTLIEVAVVLGILAILALMSLPSYLDRIVRQQIEAALPLADYAKKPVADFWSATLSFPADNAAVQLPAADKIVSNYIQSLTVEDGAIHLVFGNRAHGALTGKTLSLRPAYVADAPTVPLTWVCGSAQPPDKMTVQGSNRSNVEELYLPLACRILKTK